MRNDEQDELPLKGGWIWRIIVVILWIVVIPVFMYKGMAGENVVKNLVYWAIALIAFVITIAMRNSEEEDPFYKIFFFIATVVFFLGMSTPLFHEKGIEICWKLKVNDVALTSLFMSFFSFFNFRECTARFL